jgi:hypothetical protein
MHVYFTCVRHWNWNLNAPPLLTQKAGADGGGGAASLPGLGTLHNLHRLRQGQGQAQGQGQGGYNYSLPLPMSLSLSLSHPAEVALGVGRTISDGLTRAYRSGADSFAGVGAGAGASSYNYSHYRYADSAAMRGWLNSFKDLGSQAVSGAVSGAKGLADFGERNVRKGLGALSAVGAGTRTIGLGLAGSSSNGNNNGNSNGDGAPAAVTDTAPAVVPPAVPPSATGNDVPHPPLSKPTTRRH